MTDSEAAGREAAQERLKQLLDSAGDKAKLPFRAAHLAYKLFRDPRFLTVEDVMAAL